MVCGLWRSLGWVLFLTVLSNPCLAGRAVGKGEDPWGDDRPQWPEDENTPEKLFTKLKDAWEAAKDKMNVEVVVLHRALKEVTDHVNGGGQSAQETVTGLAPEPSLCALEAHWKPTCNSNNLTHLQCGHAIPISQLKETFFHATEAKFATNPSMWENIRFDVSADVCIGPAFFAATGAGWWTNPGYLQGAGYGKVMPVVFEISLDESCTGHVLDRKAYHAIRDGNQPMNGAKWLLLNWRVTDYLRGSIGDDGRELRLLPASASCNPRIKKVYILKYAIEGDYTRWREPEWDPKEARANGMAVHQFLDQHVSNKAQLGECNVAQEELPDWPESICEWKNEEKRMTCGGYCCTVSPGLSAEARAKCAPPP